MPNRYAIHNVHITRRNGVGADGVKITVTKSDGTLASIYSGDNLSGPKPNPIPADANGYATWYAGDLTDVYTVSVPSGFQVSSYQIVADTVENHRQAPGHAPGSIKLSELEAAPATGDVLTHEVKETGVHGVGAGSHFAETKSGTSAGTTDQPYFDTVQYDTLTCGTGGGHSFHGAVVVRTYADLVTAITGAATGTTIFVANGTYVVTTALPVTSNRLKIIGLGNPTLQSSGSVNLFNCSTAGSRVLFRNLRMEVVNGIALNFTSGSAAYIVEECELKSTGTGSLLVDATTLGKTRISGCDFRLEGTGIAVSFTGSGSLWASNTEITSGASATPMVSLGAGAAADQIVSLSSCSIDHLGGASAVALYVNRPNVKMAACSLDAATYGVQLDTGATNANVSTVNNVIVGGTAAIDDPNVLNKTEHQFWDYTSAIITVDNSAATKVREYFQIGTAGIGGVFNHNLGARQVEFLIQVSDNASFAGNVWPFSPQIVAYDSDPTAAPGAWQNQTGAANEWSVHVTDANNCYIIAYAGDVQTGAATYTATGDYIWSAIKGGAVVATTDKEAYDYTGAGAFALKTVYVRLRARLTR